MNKRYVSILFVGMLAVAGCDNDDSSTTLNPPTPTTDELIIADCYIVRDAMEAFAAENGGLYPQGFNDQSDAGHTFLSFLPGGAQMANRYTNLATTPVFSAYPQFPGEVGIMLFPDWSNPIGYRVVGRGRDGELTRLERLVGVDLDIVAKHDAVMANLAAVATAAAEFKRRSGQYPSDVAADQLPTGETMVDLLPGGTMLTNPYSGDPSDPCDGSASYPGAVGYSPIDRNGDGRYDSYLIEAAGENGGFLICARLSHSEDEYAVTDAALGLQTAVEEYALFNDGPYPGDIETVLEILGEYSNPYTGASPFSNGLATARGEVGYVPVLNGEVIVGYIINAWGLFEEIERFEVNAE